MRVPRSMTVWWRSSGMPLLVWLLLVLLGAGVLLWQQNHSRHEVEQRFRAGVSMLGDYLTGVTADQLARERAQAEVLLADAVVAPEAFQRLVAGFGFASAVLVDSRGRVIQNYPATPSLVGQDLSGRYEHLRAALQGRPAISAVVPNAAQNIPVVAFAVPFDTPSGRRVFSGAIPIRASPLASYFTTALSLTGARVQLVDTTGSIVAATEGFDVAKPVLATQDRALADALGKHPSGRYRAGGSWCHYSSAAVPGTPWQLSATVREKVLFASLADTELAGRAALGGAAVVGLAVVLAVAHARRSRRDRQCLEEERERTRAELVRHAGELQDLNNHLADVMAMLSHDVRQPLAKIIGLGGLLQEEWAGMPDHAKTDYVQRMTVAGHRANELVTDILMLAQSDAGAMPAHPMEIDIAQVTREAVAAHQISIGMPIQVIAPDETTGIADPAQLQLIIGNLLTNAAKYGAPPIEVTVLNAGDQVAIRVADHGEGVPHDFVPHLFDRFARAGSGVATTTAGTGLGLYLVQQLAQAGGLDISYEPNQPRGAVFTLTVPRSH